MPIINNFRYRPEIDGLRAVAVLAVILFHAGFGFSGGYVGVDVFFVISGFLITSLIWKDLERGTFSFAQFWERRARRIVPALVVMMLATLAAGWFLLLPEDLKSLGEAAASQVAFIGNIYYWRKSDYFSGAADQKPLLHTWSLAVEEQFYLIVPLLLWAMFRVPALRTRMLSILGLMFVASFASSLYTVPRSPMVAFYLLPARAWELLLGSLLTFLPASASVSSRRGLREALTFVGLTLILAPIFLYTPKTPFPGLAAVPPCFGAALLIWASGLGPTLVGASLASRPVVFVGLLSYSLYLWHWPLLVLGKYYALTPLLTASRALLVGLSFLLAFLSWKFVETPFRTRRFGGTRRSVFAWAGTGLAAVLACGLLYVAKKGFTSRLPAQALKFASAKNDRNLAFERPVSTTEIQAGKLIPIGGPRSARRPRVLVWGDSHAMAALTAFDAFLQEKGLAGRAVTYMDTPPVLGWFNPSLYGLGANSSDYNEAIFSYIQSRKIPDVVLVASWDHYFRDSGNRASLRPALIATVRRIAAAGSRPWVMLNVPSQYSDVPAVLARSVISGVNPALLGERKSGTRDHMSNPQLLHEIRGAGGRILDPKPRFLDPSGQFYMIERGGVALYRDQESHLTTKGAKTMLVPMLRESLLLKR